MLNLALRLSHFATAQFRAVPVSSDVLSFITFSLVGAPATIRTWNKGLEDPYDIPFTTGAFLGANLITAGAQKELG
jgi:hypothetical protein